CEAHVMHTCPPPAWTLLAAAGPIAAGWTGVRSAAHRKYRASLARGNALFFHTIRWKELDTYFRRVVLERVLAVVRGPQVAPLCTAPHPPPSPRGRGYLKC